MSKTVYKIPFGQGYKILEKGTLIERASLAKRYPLIAGARPEEILTAIENLSMRQVETQLRNFVAAGHHVGVDHTPSLTQFATVVDDNQTEDDLDTPPTEDDDEGEGSVSSPAEILKEEESPEVATIECRYPDCEEGPFATERGRNIHETRVHGAQYDATVVTEDTETAAEEHVPTVGDIVDQREETQVVAAGAAEVDETEEPGSDLDIFSDSQDEEEDELEALISSSDDEAPKMGSQPKENSDVNDDNEDDFLKSIGVIEA